MKKAIITILIIAALCGMCRGAWLMGYNTAVNQGRMINTYKTSTSLLRIAGSANTIAADEALPAVTRTLGTQISDEVTYLLSILGL